MDLAEAVIEVFLSLASHTQGATMQALAGEVGCTLEEAHAAVSLLEKRGLSEDDPVFAHRIRLANRAAALGDAGRNVRLRIAAWPFLERLHAVTGHKAGLAVIENGCHRFIDECPHQAPDVLVNLPPLRYAEPAVLRTGSTAKAILAFLPPGVAQQILTANGAELDPSNTVFTDLESWRLAAPSPEDLARIRAEGYAWSSGERAASHSGVLSMTAPVLDWTGYARGALWLAGTPRDEREQIAGLLVGIARELSVELGYVPQ